MKIKNTPCILLPGIFIFLFANAAPAKESELTVKSPDGKIVAVVHTGEHLNYTVSFHSIDVLGKSDLGIIVDGKDLGQHAAFAGKPETKTINERYPTRGVHTSATNH